MIGNCWYFQENDVSSNEGWILRAVLDVVDQWNRRRWIKHFKLLSFACDFVVLGGEFVGAQRHVWMGLVVCGELNRKIGVVDL